jgi:hypothetical protein
MSWLLQAAKVCPPAVALDEDVLGLEVRVDEPQRVQEVQGPQDLQYSPISEQQPVETGTAPEQQPT